MYRRTALILAVTLSLFAVAPLRAADTYEIDPVHSMVIFRVGHLNVGQIYGRFNNPAGQIVFDEANPENSKFDLTIETAKIDTANQQRDDHLRSPDFFDAAQFPNITFKTTSIKAGGEADTYEVSGDLNLHGVTKPITVTVQKIGAGPGMQGEQRIGFASEVILKRSDYGISFMPNVISDEVTLLFAFEAIRQ